MEPIKNRSWWSYPSVLLAGLFVYTALYVVAFLFYPIGIVANIRIIPLLFIAWLYGRFYGVSYAVLSSILTQLLMPYLIIQFQLRDSGPPPGRPPGGAVMGSRGYLDPIIGFLTHLIIALAVGTMRKYFLQAKKEVERRKEAEIQLLEYQNHLEEKVEQRTRDLKATQNRLRQTEKLEAIGHLAGGIAHDFNNQLIGVFGYGELLQSRTDLNEKQKHYVKQILKSAQRSADLTGQLLSFARKGKQKNLTFSGHDLIKDIMELLSHSLDKKIHLHKDLKAKQSNITGDPTLIQNALLNISINSRDAMTDGGTLTFSTDQAVIDENYSDAFLKDLKPGEYLKVSISDTGCGMSDDVKSNIFEPFFTTKKEGEGTGMGLAAVYGVMEMHQGTVNVYSQEGIGTVFNLYFPLTSGEAIPLKNKNIKDEIQSSETEEYILLVDDEEYITELEQEVLQGLGYKVAIAHNGIEALEIFKKDHPSIDCVILDMIMPKMNGKETVEEMKKLNASIPILLASGFSYNDDIQWLQKEPMVKDFISKPFNLRELTSKLRNVLDS